MGFLAPLFLTGLLAIALPVAIHLIRREKPPKVPFPSLRFLKATKRKRVLFQQIQQWLLLAMRAGIIALLVFAFARPLFLQGAVGQLMDAEPRSVVLLLDRSLIMQQGDRDVRLREEALRRLSELNPGDEIGMVPFSGSPRAVRALGTDIEAARVAVEELASPGFQAPRFEPALRAADDLLGEARHSRREIVMISAFQQNGMQNVDGSWRLSPGVNLETVTVDGGDVRNLSILDVRIPERLVEGGSEHQILTRVRSNGSVHTDQASVSLWLDGDLVTRASVSLDDRSEAVVGLPVQFDSAGQRRGEIRIEGDDFESDNRYHFAMNVQSRTRVLVVNGSPSSNWFEDGAHWFGLALAGEGQELPYDVTMTTMAEFSTESLSDHDVVVLLDAGLRDDDMAGELSRFVEEGGSLLVAPGSTVDGVALSDRLGVLPARLQQTNILAGNDYLLLADRDRRHPVLEPLDIDWSARFHGYWRSEATGDGQILMRFDNGDPALIEGSTGEGKVLLLTTALDTSWSNLPLQGLYLPFVHEMLGYLSRSTQVQPVHLVGERIDLSPALPPGEQTTLRYGDGRETTVSSLDPVVVVDEPGVISVGNGESRQWIAVNVAADAASMDRVQPATLQDRLINPETRPAQTEQVRTAQLMAEIEQPQRLWWWLLVLVLGLLLLETRVANRTYR